MQKQKNKPGTQKNTSMTFHIMLDLIKFNYSKRNTKHSAFIWNLNFQKKIND